MTSKPPTDCCHPSRLPASMRVASKGDSLKYSANEDEGHGSSYLRASALVQARGGHGPPSRCPMRSLSTRHSSTIAVGCRPMPIDL
jgi:hypothetical protein